MTRLAIHAALLVCFVSVPIDAFASHLTTRSATALGKLTRFSPATATTFKRRRPETSVPVVVVAAAKSATAKKDKDNETPFLVSLFKMLRKVIFVVTSFALFPFRFLTRPLHTRFSSVPDIPSRFFGPSAPVLTGRAVRITDGDTIRFLHQPSRFHPDKLEKGQKLSEHALPIRLSTIDTPETAKFGKPGQPFGDEAKQHLKDLLPPDRPVKVRLLKRDQYGRAVADVVLPDGSHADACMLKEGLAEVYVGGGAVYGPLGKDKYLEFEEEARKAKKGIWSQKNRESAADFKKRTKED